MRKLYKICKGKVVPATEDELYLGVEPICGESILKQYFVKYWRDKLYKELGCPKELLGPNHK